MRALKSHQCCPGLNPGCANSIVNRLSLFEVGSCSTDSNSGCFSSGFPGFSTHQKPTLLHSDSNFKSGYLNPLLEILSN